jgi:hypothetical protein
VQADCSSGGWKLYPDRCRYDPAFGHHRLAASEESDPFLRELLARLRHTDLLGQLRDHHAFRLGHARELAIAGRPSELHGGCHV